RKRRGRIGNCGLQKIMANHRLRLLRNLGHLKNAERCRRERRARCTMKAMLDGGMQGVGMQSRGMQSVATLAEATFLVLVGLRIRMSCRRMSAPRLQRQETR